MVDWQALEGIGGIATALAVVIAVAFGIRQAKDAQQQRREAAALKVIESWCDPAVLRQVDRVYALPDAAPSADVERADADGAISAVYVRLELMGIMTHARLVSLDAVDEWGGGLVRVAWRKLRPWIEAKRALSGSQRPGEWFQWIAERLDERPVRDETVGAHVAHRGWRP